MPCKDSRTHETLVAFLVLHNIALALALAGVLVAALIVHSTDGKTRARLAAGLVLLQLFLIRALSRLL